MNQGARFRYALQPVLLTRQWALDDLLQQLQDVNGRLREAEQKLAQLQAEMQSVSQSWQEESASAAHLNSDRFVLVTRYLADLATQRKQQQAQLLQLQQEQEQMMEQVAKAKKGVEAAEQHRDAARAKFTRERLSAQFKDADDQWNTARQGVTTNDD